MKTSIDQILHTQTETIAGFYDRIATDYDLMTDLEGRFVRERPFFRVFLDHHRISSAVDAGCGTGFHSLLLAQLGVKVVAVDISEEMLRRVKDHAAKKNVSLTVLKSTLVELSGRIKNPVDAVFCMGNTVSHLYDEKEIRGALRSFHASVNPGGILLLQMLNYDRILKIKTRIQNVRVIGGKTFVRFYDFGDTTLAFNVLRIEQRDGDLVHQLDTVQLRPWQSDQLAKMTKEAGFSSIQMFGGISMEEYVPSTSVDVVLLARKGQ